MLHIRRKITDKSVTTVTRSPSVLCASKNLLYKNTPPNLSEASKRPPAKVRSILCMELDLVMSDYGIDLRA